VERLPVRGSAVRRVSLPLPPGRMPPLRALRPLKRWRYVAAYGPELMLCVARARVAGISREWWAVAEPGGALTEGSAGVELRPGVARVAEGAVAIELELREADGVEVVSPHGRSYIWTRKQACLPVRGRVAVGGREWELAGDRGFIDDSAGYHARHTRWRWSASIGDLSDGRHVGWNLVEGVHDAPEASERTLWLDGRPQELPPQAFAADLSGVGGLRFLLWSERRDRANRLLVRSQYRQPFGTFSGELPGGLRLTAGYGVMEWHDVRW
jgi:hypothetical protein